MGSEPVLESRNQHLSGNPQHDAAVTQNTPADSVASVDELDQGDAFPVYITVTWRKETVEYCYPSTEHMETLWQRLADEFPFDPAKAKLLGPKGRIYRWGHGSESNASLLELDQVKLRLLAPTRAENDNWQKAESESRRRAAARSEAELRRAAASRPAVRKTTGSSSPYTFLDVRPLQMLPHPGRSLSLLRRLCNDPGIKAVMQRHKLTVNLLTEMEPLSHTQVSHEGTSRILGLNRNKGEVIELRLRTDAHDGYRDYKTIRKTLCHELAHNHFSEHDRNFWDFCHQLEREVSASDYNATGRTLDGEAIRGAMHGSSYDEEDEHQDAGGWTGGQYLLGGVSATQPGVSRRDILARAAEERQKQDRASRDLTKSNGTDEA